LDDVTLELFKHSAEQCRRKFSQVALPFTYLLEQDRQIMHTLQLHSPDVSTSADLY